MKSGTHRGRLATRKRGRRVDGSAPAEGEAPPRPAPAPRRGAGKGFLLVCSPEARFGVLSRVGRAWERGAWSRRVLRGGAARGRATGARTLPTGARAPRAKPQFPHFAAAERAPHGVPGALPRSPTAGLGGRGLGNAHRPRRCETDPPVPRAPAQAGMFVLVEMVDTVRIPPWQFERKLNDSIAEELNKKLANKVVGPRGRRQALASEGPALPTCPLQAWPWSCQTSALGK